MPQYNKQNRKDMRNTFGPKKDYTKKDHTKKDWRIKMPELDINGILQQYHDKFDDSKVRELLEELEQMMYERADFFRDFHHEENKDVDKKTSEKVNDYWIDVDNLAYGSEQHNEILGRLKNDVSGMNSCWCCRRISALRTKMMQSIPSEELYLVKMCEKCYCEKVIVTKYRKREIEKDTEIPEDLSDEEKSLMEQFQESLPAESQVE